MRRPFAIATTGTAALPLTDSQRRTLELAIKCAEGGELDGVFPTGFQQRVMYAHLEERGLLMYVGEGEDSNGITQRVRQVSIYAITDEGRAAIYAINRAEFSARETKVLEDDRAANRRPCEDCQHDRYDHQHETHDWIAPSGIKSIEIKLGGCKHCPCGSYE